MSRMLRLMEEVDLPQVKIAVAMAFAPRSAKCALDFQHDDERLILTVAADVPAKEIGRVYRNTVVPLLGELEDKFGEFGFNMRSLCACGEMATPMFSDGSLEHDMCLCDECLGREIVGTRDDDRNICPVCETDFDGYESPGWRVSYSVKLVSEECEAEPEMDIEYGYLGFDISRWSCCSRECAIERLHKWLSEVESHPVVKEAKG